MMYYLLQWTWGFPLTTIGAIAYLIFAKIFNYPIKKYKNNILILIPYSNFTGLNLGLFTLINKDRKDLIIHEYGHSIQNILFGWFTIFIITIPSIIRFWYRTLKTVLNKENKTGYYDIWFERQATRLGEALK